MLARQLQADRAVYALNCIYGLSSIEDAPLEIEQLAQRYVAAMRAVQPSGPYFLYGFCTGAMVAYEMAQQLIRKGESVGHLLLAGPPVSGMGSIKTATAIMRAMGSQGLSLAQFQRLSVVVSRIAKQLPGFLGMKLKIARYTLAGPMPPELMMELHLQRLRPAMQQYRYESLPCPLEIVYGKLSAAQLDSATNIWTDIIGHPLEVHTVPQAVAHMDLLQLPIAIRFTAALIDGTIPSKVGI